MDQLIEKLRSNNIQCYVTNNREEAQRIALELIPQGALSHSWRKQNCKGSGRSVDAP